MNFMEHWRAKAGLLQISSSFFGKIVGARSESIVVDNYILTNCMSLHSKSLYINLPSNLTMSVLHFIACAVPSYKISE